MIIKSEDRTVEAVLNRPIIYEVPRYQRCFSWEREQVEAFWEDLMETMAEKREDYFLGSFIFRQKGKHKIEIIDGQQRMALLMIFFTCIRDKYEKRGNSYAAGQIEGQYIARRISFTNKERVYKLTLNKQDNQYFRDYILKRSFDLKKKFIRKRGTLQSHKLMKNAYDFFWEKISQEVDKYSPLDEKANNYLEEISGVVANRFKIITTLVDQDAEAYLIFETLNDRGLDLSIADLLKNYIYFKAEKVGTKTLEFVQKGWEEVVAIFSGRGLNNFLRHYWSSSKELVREKKLYKAFKNNLREGKEVYDFAGNLREEAKIYHGLITPTRDFWGNKPTVIRLLEDLKILGVKQIYPLLLSGYIKLGRSELKKLIDFSLKLSFRYSTICNFNPNQLERKYSDLAILLRHGKLNFIQVRERLKELNPDDSVFIQEFAKKQIRKAQIARYILREMANYIIKGKEKVGELKIQENQEKVNLEHIMPKTPSKEWEDYIKKHNLNHRELVHRLGNMTLLTGPKNKEASNKLFRIKCKKIYSKSKIPITKELCKDKKWNEDTITERQKGLANVAKNIWKV